MSITTTIHTSRAGAGSFEGTVEGSLTVTEDASIGGELDVEFINTSAASIKLMRQDTEKWRAGGGSSTADFSCQESLGRVIGGSGATGRLFLGYASDGIRIFHSANSTAPRAVKVVQNNVDTTVWDSDGNITHEEDLHVKGDLEVDGAVGIEATVSAPSGNFTAGKLHLVRIGRTVTIQILENFEHSSTPAPASASGFIPEAFRPTFLGEGQFVNNVMNAGGDVLFIIRILANGELRFLYRDYSGSATNQTTTGSNAFGTISYTIGDE